MRLAYALILAISLSAISAEALDIPPKPEGYVNDYASILSPTAKSSLETTLAKFESQNQGQIVVATFKSLEGESLEDFSIRLAEKWRIGIKGKDNGVILLIFRDEKKIRIDVGYGLEGVLPDAICGIIIRNEIAPYFKKGDYDGGVSKGIYAIIKAIGKEYEPPQGAGEKDFLWNLVLIIAILLVMIIINYTRYKNSGSYWGASSGGHYGDRWGSYGGSGGGWGGGFSGGGGGFGGGGASGSW